jgi:hypothetical protein
MFGNCECLTNSLCHCPSRYCVQTGVVVCAHAATSLLGYGGTAANVLSWAKCGSSILIATIRSMAVSWGPPLTHAAVAQQLY